MSVTEHQWIHLPPAEKQLVVQGLRETILKSGHAAPNALATPAAFAAAHNRRFQIHAHTQAIDDALTWLHRTPGGRLMIWTPPRAGKSWLAARYFPAWWQTQHPLDAVALISYSASLATRHGAAARDIVREHGAQYGLRLVKANRDEWTTTAGGSLDAVGVGGALTGKDMHLGIIDDPFKDRAEADSPVIRENVWDWYSSVFATRRVRRTRMLIINTRWHQDDLCGRILKDQGRVEDGGRWRVLHLPALAVAEDRPRGFYADPLGRDPGQPLTHPDYDDTDTDGLLAHWAQARADSVARDWNAMYQGSPHDAEGALLNDNDLRDATVDTYDEPMRIAVAVDPSGGGRDEAGIVAGVLTSSGKVVITHDRTARMPANQWAEKACLLAVEVDADRIIVEKNYGGDIALDLVRLTWEKLQQQERVPADRLCPLVMPVDARRNKVLRAEPVAAAIKSGRVKLVRDGLEKVRIEFTQWEPGSTWSPGALDAAVHLVTKLAPTPPRAAGRGRGEGRGEGRKIERG